MSVNVRSNNPLLLFRPVCRTNSHYHSFYPSAIALWNDLPHSVTSSLSLYSFKHNVNQHLKRTKKFMVEKNKIYLSAL